MTRFPWLDLLAVAVGGGVGSVVRWGLALRFPTQEDGFPLSTFLANVTGTFVIALVAGLFERHAGLSPSLRIFLATGFCGGLTTFSTLLLDGARLAERGAWLTLAFYAATTVFCGILAFLAGSATARLF